MGAVGFVWPDRLLLLALHWKINWTKIDFHSVLQNLGKVLTIQNISIQSQNNEFVQSWSRILPSSAEAFVKNVLGGFSLIELIKLWLVVGDRYKEECVLSQFSHWEPFRRKPVKLVESTIVTWHRHLFYFVPSDIISCNAMAIKNVLSICNA